MTSLAAMQHADGLYPPSRFNTTGAMFVSTSSAASQPYLFVSERVGKRARELVGVFVSTSSAASQPYLFVSERVGKRVGKRARELVGASVSSNGNTFISKR
jgi:hypothetical protein